jgi:hypothetical protein
MQSPFIRDVGSLGAALKRSRGDKHRKSCLRQHRLNIQQDRIEKKHRKEICNDYCFEVAQHFFSLYLFLIFLKFDQTFGWVLRL